MVEVEVENVRESGLVCARSLWKKRVGECGKRSFRVQF